MKADTEDNYIISCIYEKAPIYRCFFIVRHAWRTSRRCKSAVRPSMGRTSLGKGVYREVESEGS